MKCFLAMVTALLVASLALAQEGFILKTGLGEALDGGIFVKASPAMGTQGSILVEHTFQIELLMS